VRAAEAERAALVRAEHEARLEAAAARAATAEAEAARLAAECDSLRASTKQASRCARAI
jgi:hypothetical protein